jgi:hypothetical protein
VAWRIWDKSLRLPSHGTRNQQLALECWPVAADRLYRRDLVRALPVHPKDLPE